MQPTLDRSLVHLSPADNVAAARRTLEAGETVCCNGVSMVVERRTPVGHKLAVRPIEPGQKVLKYGAPIGLATCRILPGQYVHTHNLKSDYLPTYTLDGANPYLNHS